MHITYIVHPPHSCATHPPAHHTLPCHPTNSLTDIVEIKHIILPPSPTAYRDIFVIFELLETDLHQVHRDVGGGMCGCVGWGMCAVWVCHNTILLCVPLNIHASLCRDTNTHNSPSLDTHTLHSTHNTLYTFTPHTIHSTHNTRISHTHR